MNIDNADVVVIGGGVIGLSTAYFTLKEGKDVVLLDKGIPGWEASGPQRGLGRGPRFDTGRYENLGADDRGDQDLADPG